MQDSRAPGTRQASSQPLRERIDRLEWLLQDRQQWLGRQMVTLQERLAQFGLDTAEKVIAAYEQLDASDRDALQRQVRPATSTEPNRRTTVARRIGRMV